MVTQHIPEHPAFGGQADRLCKPKSKFEFKHETATRKVEFPRFPLTGDRVVPAVAARCVACAAIGMGDAYTPQSKFEFKLESESRTARAGATTEADGKTCAENVANDGSPATRTLLLSATAFTLCVRRV
jgi:hypothetical protein